MWFYLLFYRVRVGFGSVQWFLEAPDFPFQVCSTFSVLVVFILVYLPKIKKKRIPMICTNLTVEFIDCFEQLNL